MKQGPSRGTLPDTIRTCVYSPEEKDVGEVPTPRERPGVTLSTNGDILK